MNGRTEEAMETLTVAVTAERYPSPEWMTRPITDAEVGDVVDAISMALGGIQVDYWRVGVERTGGRFSFTSDPLDELA